MNPDEVSVMHDREALSERLCLNHFGVLALGFAAGLVAALVVCAIPFDFSAQIAEARRLGVVSKTILAGYAKKRDIVNYAALILLPVFCSLGAWLIWSRGRRGELAALLREEEGASAAFPGKPLVAAVILLGALFLTFNINNFYEPAGGWGFLGEEGQFLADAQILLGGGDYAKDFFCLYGPLVVYPIALAMKLFGATVVVARFYSYLLVLISAALLMASLYCTVRSRAVFILASLLSLLTFVSGGGRTNATLLRVTLGFLPLLILHRFAASRSTWPPLAAGLVLGISLIFSQEVGLCALIASLAFLFLEGCSAGEWLRRVRQGGLLVLGSSLVLVPVLLYFQRVGALGRFFESLYGYPKLVTLGYGSLPFPSPADFLSAPLGAAYFPYWMIGIYLFCSVYLLVQLLLGQGNRELHFRSALLVLGLLLFRAALGRSDESHFFFASLPAFLLAFLLLDDALRGLAGSRLKALATGWRAVAALLLLSMLLLFGTTPVLRDNLFTAFSEIGRLGTKFSVQQAGVPLPGLTRGGIFYDAATAQDLTKIGQALERYTKPGEPVLFFPNEAAYYFLFDRPVPTRYVHAYFAASAAQRRDLVADLEQSRPAYVVYTLDNWRIDDILEDVQVPEVSRYLKEKYELAEDLGNILILRRKP